MDNFSDSEDNEDSSKVHNKLYSDNEELKRRLLAFERVSEENRSLRKTKEECGILRSCLKKSQDEISVLLADKSKLINEIRKLREQMISRESSSKCNNSKR